ncbi:MAG: cytochrome P450 [Streptosporangiales bacterium]|nr:cytochrome P450 [Streptosporangiales bacterium]
MATSYIIDLDDVDLVQDPYHGYSRIRERVPRVAPAHQHPAGHHWMVTRYADVAALYCDPRFVSNPLNVPDAPMRHLREEVLRTGETPTEYMPLRTDRMARRDGAGHTRLRRAVDPAFHARVVAGLRTRIERLAEDLLDRLPDATEEDGTVDLLRHYALPLPNAVLCELMGIPQEVQSEWLRWTTEVKVGSLSLDARAERWRALTDFARDLISQRRAAPGHDLISSLLAAGDNGEGLTETEIISIMLMDHNAHRALGHLIANGTVALLTHPEQLELLRKHPEMMPQAVEEMLRFCSPSTVGGLQHATEDVRIGETTIRKGEAVWPAVAAANWDPRRFSEPERLDVTARRDAHIAFGEGPHSCAGPALARLTAEVALAALLRRHPGLAPGVDPSTLTREHRPRQWGLEALPIRL